MPQTDAEFMVELLAEYAKKFDMLEKPGYPSVQGESLRRQITVLRKAITNVDDVVKESRKLIERFRED